MSRDQYKPLMWPSKPVHDHVVAAHGSRYAVGSAGGEAASGGEVLVLSGVRAGPPQHVEVAVGRPVDHVVNPVGLPEPADRVTRSLRRADGACEALVPS